MKQCDNCGSPVTDDFHRVYSDNSGRLLACSQCADSFKDAVYEANGRDRRDTYMHGRYRR